MGIAIEMRITMIVTTTISSTKVNPRLPIRIGRVVQPHFIGAAANVENPGLRLIDSLTRILLNGVPGLVAAGDRIDGELDQIAFHDQVLQVLRRLLLVVGVVIDAGAQRTGCSPARTPWSG